MDNRSPPRVACRALLPPPSPPTLVRRLKLLGAVATRAPGDATQDWSAQSTKDHSCGAPSPQRLAFSVSAHAALAHAVALASQWSALAWLAETPTACPCQACAADARAGAGFLGRARREPAIEPAMVPRVVHLRRPLPARCVRQSAATNAAHLARLPPSGCRRPLPAGAVAHRASQEKIPAGAGSRRRPQAAQHRLHAKELFGHAHPRPLATPSLVPAVPQPLCPTSEMGATGAPTLVPFPRDGGRSPPCERAERVTQNRR